MGSDRRPMEKQNIRSVVGEVKKNSRCDLLGRLGAYFGGSQKREENVFYYCLHFYPFRAII